MNHLNEEQLVLYYYGERSAKAEEHLGACESCRAAYQTLAAGAEFGGQPAGSGAGAGL